MDIPPTREAPEPGKDPLPPAQIAGYRILSEIGSGGMGVVYLAEQRHPVHRRVALKLIRLGLDTKNVLARFEAERQALALMDHPCIARVFDAGTSEDGRAFFTMELVNGLPIHAYCDQLRLSVRERIELFIRVCDGVAHAHAKGIVHRDLKPQNVLVIQSDGIALPKIIDFGVAKAIAHRLTDRTVMTEQGQLVGTPDYMSPEQAELTGLDIDARSDLYTLGVLLYELLVGVLPFDPSELRRAGLLGIQRVIREEEPPRPSLRVTQLGGDATTIAERRDVTLRGLTNGLRGDLDKIVLFALQKDRTRRYQSAREFANDLRRYLDNRPVEARAPSLLYRLGKFSRRRRVPIAFGIAVVAALMIGVLASDWLGVGGGRRPFAGARFACEPLFAWTGNGVGGLFGNAIVGAGDVDRDGCGDVLVGSPYLSEWNKAAGVAEVFSGRTGEILYSLMGKRLAYDRVGGSLASGGDFDGDGWSDLLVGAWGNSKNGKRAGAVFVYSGKVGRLIGELYGERSEDSFGERVAIVGDLNGDGAADFLAGAPQTRSQGNGYVQIYCGKTRQSLARLQGPHGGSSFGGSLAGLGDVTGDGVPDFVISACYENVVRGQAEASHVGAVYAYSGSDNSLLMKIEGDEADDAFGWRVAAAGDVDADEVMDFAASSYLAMGRRGLVRIYSGRDFRLLHEIAGERQADELGRSLSSIGDLDGDGHADLLIGALAVRPRPGFALVISGKSGERLARIEGVGASNFGLAVCGPGDLDGDGTPDVAVGAPEAGENGATYVFSGRRLLEAYRPR